MSQVFSRLRSSSFARRQLHLGVAALLILAGLLFPVFGGWNRSACGILGLFVATLYLWLVESIDWPSLVALLGLMLVPELGPKWVLARTLGDSTVAFLLFTFLCTYALSRSGVLRRVALGFLAFSWARRGRAQFLVAYLLGTATLGLFLSPTVLFMVLLALHRECVELLQLRPGDALASHTLIGQTLFCALTSGMTPIGHAFPILAMGNGQTVAGVHVSAWNYLCVAFPTGLLAGACILVLLLWSLKRKDRRGPPPAFDGAQLPKRGAWTVSQKRSCFVFVLVIAGWIVPGMAVTLGIPGARFWDQLGPAFPPLVGAVLLFLLIDEEKQPLLPFAQALQKGVAWGSVWMAAATLGFGAALTEEKLGMGTFLRDQFAAIGSGLTPFALCLVLVVWAGIQTNLSSNIVTVSLLSLVALPLTRSVGLRPEVVVVALGLLASCSFATPPAHPNVALTVGSGWVRPWTMLRWGCLALFVVWVSWILVGYPLSGVPGILG